MHIALRRPPSPARLLLKAVIFDVDGVLLASPHERAWREALAGLAPPERFTTALYQGHVASRPRLEGARAALEALGVPHASEQADDYADRKQALLEALIRNRCVKPYPDALRFLRAVQAMGWPIAATSSSKNANGMMQLTQLSPGHMLLDAFDANLCGRQLARGKPDPKIFLHAAAALQEDPACCCVVEDSPAGIAAARAGGMAALGTARLDDAASLHAAGANLVVTSLDDVAIESLAQGHLCRT